ncbi:YDG domain-containing protein [Polynucleobacter rarus]|uniref:YDG domain-containing protein n=1 Tax=Polynucleobacter rarus TaxID=556055 RepID=UPI00131EE53D|nr:YDG domain-containing protein [Polynucleobacter rarus]
MPNNSLPTGGVVNAGVATINQSQNTLNINQSSQNAVIGWKTFNVGSNATVNFNQPSASSATLNVVNGSSKSMIDGAVNANGQVIFSNQNGVVFGKNAEVNVGGMVATTMNINQDEFMAGNMKQTYSGNSNSSAKVINKGKITGNNINSYIALMAPEVKNEGVISATLSGANAIALVSGQKVTLTFHDQQLINVYVDASSINSLIQNKRLIQVDGGNIIIAANSAQALRNSVVQNSGTISASGINKEGGVITLVGNKVVQAGIIESNSASSTGGQVNITGNEINLTSQSQTTATGTLGGGEILIGKSNNNSPLTQVNAKKVNIDKGAIVDVSATKNGNGGVIQVWSEQTTVVAGKFYAKGGLLSGNGGTIDTSSAGKVSYGTGLIVDTTAPKGKIGNWITDPLEITIDQTAALVISNALKTTNVTLDATLSSCGGFGSCVQSSVPTISFLAGADIFSQNQLTSLSLNAVGGSININNNITAGAVYAVAQAINVNGSINTNGGTNSSIYLAGAIINLLGNINSNGSSNNSGSSNSNSSTLNAANTSTRNNRRNGQSGLNSDNTIYTSNGGNINIISTGDINIGSNAYISANGINGGTINIISISGNVNNNGIIDSIGKINNGGNITIVGKTLTEIIGALISSEGLSQGGVINLGQINNLSNGSTLAPPATAPPSLISFINNAVVTAVDSNNSITSSNIILDSQSAIYSPNGNIVVFGEKIQINNSTLVAQNGDITIGRPIYGYGALAKIASVSNSTLTANRVETSADLLGTQLNTVVANQWLLDPTNITITASASTSGSLASALATAGVSNISTADIKAAVDAGGTVNVVATGTITQSGALAFAPASGVTGTLILENSATQAQNITLSGGITSSGAGTVNLKVLAGGQAISSGAISSSSGPINVTMQSFYSGNTTGTILGSNIYISGSITTKGGNLLLDATGGTISGSTITPGLITNGGITTGGSITLSTTTDGLAVGAATTGGNFAAAGSRSLGTGAGAFELGAIAPLNVGGTATINISTSGTAVMGFITGGNVTTSPITSYGNLSITATNTTASLATATGMIKIQSALTSYAGSVTLNTTGSGASLTYGVDATAAISGASGVSITNNNLIGIGVNTSALGTITSANGTVNITSTTTGSGILAVNLAGLITAPQVLITATNNTAGGTGATVTGGITISANKNGASNTFTSVGNALAITSTVGTSGQAGGISVSTGAITNNSNGGNVSFVTNGDITATAAINFATANTTNHAQTITYDTTSGNLNSKIITGAFTFNSTGDTSPVNYVQKSNGSALTIGATSVSGSILVDNTNSGTTLAANATTGTALTVNGALSSGGLLLGGDAIVLKAIAGTAGIGINDAAANDSLTASVGNISLNTTTSTGAGITFSSPITATTGNVSITGTSTTGATIATTGLMTANSITVSGTGTTAATVVSLGAMTINAGGGNISVTGNDSAAGATTGITQTGAITDNANGGNISFVSNNKIAQAGAITLVANTSGTASSITFNTTSGNYLSTLVNGAITISGSSTSPINFIALSNGAPITPGAITMPGYIRIDNTCYGCTTAGVSDLTATNVIATPTPNATTSSAITLGGNLTSGVGIYLNGINSGTAVVVSLGAFNLTVTSAASFPTADVAAISVIANHKTSNAGNPGISSTGTVAIQSSGGDLLFQSNGDISLTGALNLAANNTNHAQSIKYDTTSGNGNSAITIQSISSQGASITSPVNVTILSNSTITINGSIIQNAPGTAAAPINILAESFYTANTYANFYAFVNGSNNIDAGKGQNAQFITRGGYVVLDGTGGTISGLGTAGITNTMGSIQNGIVWTHNNLQINTTNDGLAVSASTTGGGNVILTTSRSTNTMIPGNMDYGAWEPGANQVINAGGTFTANIRVIGPTGIAYTPGGFAINSPINALGDITLTTFGTGGASLNTPAIYLTSPFTSYSGSVNLTSSLVTPQLSIKVGAAISAATGVTLTSSGGTNIGVSSVAGGTITTTGGVVNIVSTNSTTVYGVSIAALITAPKVVITATNPNLTGEGINITGGITISALDAGLPNTFATAADALTLTSTVGTSCITGGINVTTGAITNNSNGGNVSYVTNGDINSVAAISFATANTTNHAQTITYDTTSGNVNSKIITGAFTFNSNGDTSPVNYVQKSNGSALTIGATYVSGSILVDNTNGGTTLAANATTGTAVTVNGALSSGGLLLGSDAITLKAIAGTGGIGINDAATTYSLTAPIGNISLTSTTSTGAGITYASPITATSGSVSITGTSTTGATIAATGAITGLGIMVNGTATTATTITSLGVMTVNGLYVSGTVSAPSFISNTSGTYIGTIATLPTLTSAAIAGTNAGLTGNIQSATVVYAVAGNTATNANYLLGWGAATAPLTRIVQLNLQIIGGQLIATETGAKTSTTALTTGAGTNINTLWTGGTVATTQSTSLVTAGYGIANLGFSGSPVFTNTASGGLVVSGTGTAGGNTGITQTGVISQNVSGGNITFTSNNKIAQAGAITLVPNTSGVGSTITYDTTSGNLNSTIATGALGIGAGTSSSAINYVLKSSGSALNISATNVPGYILVDNTNGGVTLAANATTGTAITVSGALTSGALAGSNAITLKAIAGTAGIGINDAAANDSLTASVGNISLNTTTSTGAGITFSSPITATTGNVSITGTSTTGTTIATTGLITANSITVSGTGTTAATVVSLGAMTINSGGGNISVTGNDSTAGATTGITQTGAITDNANGGNISFVSNNAINQTGAITVAANTSGNLSSITYDTTSGNKNSTITSGALTLTGGVAASNTAINYIVKASGGAITVPATVTMPGYILLDNTYGGTAGSGGTPSTGFITLTNASTVSTTATAILVNGSLSSGLYAGTNAITINAVNSASPATSLDAFLMTGTSTITATTGNINITGLSTQNNGMSIYGGLKTLAGDVNLIGVTAVNGVNIATGIRIMNQVGHVNEDILANGNITINGGSAAASSGGRAVTLDNGSVVATGNVIVNAYNYNTDNLQSSFALTTGANGVMFVQAGGNFIISANAGQYNSSVGARLYQITTKIGGNFVVQDAVSGSVTNSTGTTIANLSTAGAAGSAVQGGLYGIYIQQSNPFTYNGSTYNGMNATGNITMNGSSNGTTGIGVYMVSTPNLTTTSGNINITASTTTAGDVAMNNTSGIFTSGGSINLTGTSSTGVSIQNGASISAVSGVTITGTSTSGTSSGAYGQINMNANGVTGLQNTVTNTGSGDITITSTGNINSSSLLNDSGTGGINITGGRSIAAGTITGGTITAIGTLVNTGGGVISLSMAQPTSVTGGAIETAAGVTSANASVASNVAYSQVGGVMGAINSTTLNNVNYRVGVISPTISVALTGNYSAVYGTAYNSTSANTWIQSASHATPTVTGGGFGSAPTTAQVLASLSFASNLGTVTNSNLVQSTTSLIGTAKISSPYGSVTTTGTSTYTITPATLTITGNSTNSIYDGVSNYGTLANNGYTVSGLVSGFTASTGTVTASNDSVSSVTHVVKLGATPVTNSAVAQSGTFTDTPSVATGSGLSNYTFVYNPGTFTVNKANLSITQNSASNVTYNGAIQNGLTTYTPSGLLGSDTITGFATNNAATGTNAGTYTGTISGATGSGLSNYTISYNGGSLVIGKANLSVTQDSSNLTYNGFTQSGLTTYTKSGLLGSDTITGFATNTAATGTNFGTYTGTISGATGTGLSNYTISYNSGSLVIGKANLSITQGSSNLTYNGSAQSGLTTYTQSGLLGSDTISGFVTNTAATGTNVGTYTGSISGATGTGLSNYTITYNAGSLVIGKANLSVTQGSSNLTYNGSAQSGLTTYTSSGLLGSDTITGFATNTAGSGTNVGTYTGTISGATGTGLSNYTISYNVGSLVIGKAALTISGGNTSATFDNTTHTNTYNITSGALFGSDIISSVSGLGSGLHANTYNDSGLSASGTGLSNYTISYVPGSLTINPATLTAAITPNVATYNGTNVLTNATVLNGVINGTTVSGTTSLTLSGVNAGTQTITNNGTTLSGANSGDYVIASSSILNNGGIGAVNNQVTPGAGLNNSGSTIVIVPKALTVTGSLTTPTYNGNAQTNTYTVTGLVGSEMITATGSAQATHVAQGLIADNLVPVAGASTLLSNYSITTTNGSIQVNPLAITGTAQVNGKTYNGTTAGTGTIALTGVLLADQGSTTASGTFAFANANAGAAKAATVSGVTINNTDYSVTVAPSAGTATITPANLTIAGNSTTPTYNGNLQTNTYTVTGAVPGETITATGSAQATHVAQGSIADSLVPVAGAGTLLSNYSITTTNGSIQVNPLAITGSAQVNGKVYNGTTSGTGTIILTGVLPADVATTSASGTFTFANANAGLGKTATVSGVTINNTDYSVTVPPSAGSATITAATLTITGGTNSATFDNTTHTNTYSITSGALFGSDVISSVSGLGSGLHANTYNDSGLSVSGTGLSNYTISYVPGSLTINPATLIAAITPNVATYNGTNVLANATVLNGVINGTTVNGTTSLTLSGVNAGTQTITNNGTTLSGPNAGDYVIASSSILNNGGSGAANNQVTPGAGPNNSGSTIVIVPKALTVTGNNTTPTYNGNPQTNTYTVTGLIPGETVTATGSAQATRVAQGLIADNLVPVAGASTLLSNYSITTTNGSIQVNPLGITGTAQVNGKTYNGTTAGTGSIALTGVLLADQGSTTASGTFTFANANAGATKSATVSGVTINNTDYSVTVAPSAGSATITPATLTIVGNTTTPTYNGNLQTNTYTVTGVVPGETITATGSAQATNVVQGSITDNLLPVAGSGTSLSNYSITTTNGTIQINPLAITGTALVNAKTYNGSTLGAGTISLSGVLPADAATTTASGTFTFGSANVGTQSATVSNVSVNNPNYSITMPSSVAGTAIIAKAALTISGGTTNTTFNNTTLTNTYSITSGQLFGSDTIASVSGLGSGLHANTYTDTSLAASGTGLSNYTISYVTGSLTVNPASLTATVTPSLTTYNGSNVIANSTVLTGVVSGTSVSSTTSLTINGINAGSQTIINNGSTLTGPNASDYIIVNSSLSNNGVNGVTPTNSGGVNGNFGGTILIAKAPLTVSGTKVYDGTGTFTYLNMMVSGAQNGEIISLTSGSAQTSSPNAGSYVGTSINNLAIAVSGGSALSSNYQLPNSGSFNVSPAPVTNAGTPLTYRSVVTSNVSSSPSSVSGMGGPLANPNGVVVQLANNSITNGTALTSSQNSNSNNGSEPSLGNNTTTSQATTTANNRARPQTNTSSSNQGKAARKGNGNNKANSKAGANLQNNINSNISNFARPNGSNFGSNVTKGDFTPRRKTYSSTKNGLNRTGNSNNSNINSIDDARNSLSGTKPKYSNGGCGSGKSGVGAVTSANRSCSQLRAPGDALANSYHEMEWPGAHKNYTGSSAKAIGTIDYNKKMDMNFMINLIILF